MSSFGSVLRKPGQKLTPKAAPKRNVIRRTQVPTPATTPNSTREEEALQELADETSSRSAEAENSQKHDQRSLPHQKQAQGYELRSRRESASAHFDNESPGIRTSQIPDHLESTASHTKSNRKTPDVHLNVRSATTRSQTRSVEFDLNQQVGTQPLESQSSANEAEEERMTVATKRKSTGVYTSPRKRKAISRTRTSPVLDQSVRIETPVSRKSASTERMDLALASRNSVQESIEYAREQAATVGNLAQAINFSPERARSQSLLQSGLVRTSEEAASRSTEEVRSGQTSESQNSKRKPKRSRKQKSLEQQAAEVVANAAEVTDLLKKKRGPTPEDLENHTIQEDEITMGELCKDRRWGQKSETERQMQENWPEIMRRRKEERERALLEAQSSRKRAHTRNELPINRQAKDVVQSHPQMTIVGGNIVVEQAGRELDRMEDLNQQIAETVEILEDTDIYKRVNTSTVGVKNKIPAGQNWDPVNTELFYRGLTMFGTDFMMISNMIPGKTRKQVKLKYNVEERNNWYRIKQSLDQKRTVDLGEYGQLAGLEFTNAADVYKQMEEDEKRLREEDERRRREDGIVNNEAADIPIDSIEGDGIEGGVTEGGVDATSRGGSRLESTARQTTQLKKRQTKKTTATSRRGRQATSNVANYEGTEERLGTIEEVAV